VAGEVCWSLISKGEWLSGTGNKEYKREDLMGKGEWEKAWLWDPLQEDGIWGGPDWKS